ncbi:hypothetical protein F511_11746 [Dorcoceras hygrometricum]|uniref:Uncharacterized protein n=1 Tax=Dorcoceras hygrometricum TaxID=472368 RepID=A0A2Z7BYE6_9LAMI|nr:hypothetical protein F511_11746 [Dorcoceras hygrometricum]
MDVGESHEECGGFALGKFDKDVPKDSSGLMIIRLLEVEIMQITGIIGISMHRSGSSEGSREITQVCIEEHRTEELDGEQHAPIEGSEHQAQSCTEGQLAPNQISRMEKQATSISGGGIIGIIHEENDTSLENVETSFEQEQLAPVCTDIYTATEVQNKEEQQVLAQSDAYILFALDLV